MQSLETRYLLAVGPIPPSVDPASATQTALAPESTRIDIPAAAPGASSRLFQFALDGTGFSAAAQFDVSPTLPTSTSDAALALYDDSGNLIASADAGPAANPGAENLAATIERGRPYVLGVYFAPSGPPVNYTVRAATGPQLLNTPVAINPASGVAQLNADSGEDTFNSPADVDYYPLDLLNGGSAGTVTVTPTGPGVKVFATLFRKDLLRDIWLPTAGGSDAGGGPVTLPASPDAQTSLTDSEYLLAVAPLGFGSAASSYRIDVAAAPLLGPAAVNPATPGLTDLLTPPPQSVGVAGVTQTDSLPVGGQQLFRFRAPATGVATLSLSSASFQPVLSAYDASGAGVLDVASRTAAPVGAPTAMLSLPVVAGTAYVVRVGDVGSDAGGAYTFSLSEPYTPQTLALGQGATTINGIPIDAGAAANFYRLSPAYGTDVLAVQLAAGAGGGARLVLVGSNLPVVQRDVSAGQTVFLPVDLGGGWSSPIDLYVTGTSGVSAAQLAVAQFDLPQERSAESLTQGQLNLQGNFSLPAAPVGGFGSGTGASFYQPATDGGATALTAAGTGGARPLLAHYREQGGLLRLVDYALPSEAGVAALNEPLSPDQLHGVVAYSIGFGGGNVGLTVDGPDITGVGVGMVPDLTVNPPQYASILKIENITLERESEQNLWRTILPYNILAVPTVTFDLTSADLSTTVSVYWGDGPSAGQQIGGDVNTLLGQPTTFSLAATVDALKGRTIVFRVKPRPNLLGGGVYTLRMNVATSNPFPYFVTETAWKLANTTPSYVGFDGNDVGTIPIPSRGAAIRDVVQNQFGDGSTTGDFFSSTPDADGSVDVYRFWAITRGPVSVRTVPIDAGVNTTLRLYRARFKPDGTLDYLGQIKDVSDSRDWYAAERSQIDAQTFINDFGVIDYDFQGDATHDRDSDPYHTHGEMYFVVVKNEEGTLGRYRLVVDASSFHDLGGTNPAPPTINDDAYTQATRNVTTYVNPAAGGTQNVKMNFTANFSEFLGYFPIQVPDYHDGTLSLSSQSGSKWDFSVFDASGHPLSGSSTDTLTNTTGTFTLPSGPQTVYLRAKEQSANSNPNPASSVNVTIDVALPPGVTAPSLVLPGSPAPVLLPTTPTGDGSVTDSMTANGQVEKYAFRAAAGTLTINVTPETATEVQLRWGVYVDGVLRAWDQTRVSGADFVPGTTGTTLRLPSFREPIVNPDFSWDRAEVHDVVVYVQSTSVPQSGGNFTVAVDSDATLPAREGALRLDPRTYFATATDTRLGTALARLIVPEYVAATPELTVQRNFALAGTAFKYQLYDMDGNLLSSQQLNSSRSSPDSVTFTLTGAAGGSSYYLRAWEVNNATSSVTLTASATVPKAGLFVPVSKPPAVIPLEGNNRADPPPDGEFLVGYQNTSLETATVSFWVGTPGVAHINAYTLDNHTQPYVALYRGLRVKSGEFDVDELHLVDYVNDTNKAPAGQYIIDAWLDPGMYVVKVVRKNTDFGTAFIQFDLPDFTAKEIVLDPNFGDSSLIPLRDMDTPDFDTPRQTLADEDRVRILTGYRTSFYHVVAPAGSQNGTDAGAFEQDGYPGGVALLTEWDRAADGGFDDQHKYVNPNHTISMPADTFAQVVPTAPAEPLHQFWIGLHRQRLESRVAVTSHFTVPFSGTPDLQVEPIVLSPDNGETRVDLLVRNLGFAPAFTNHARYRYSDASANPDTWTTSEQFEFTVAPLGQRDKVFAWPPKNPEDHVEYFTDVLNEIDELDETNNKQDRQLAEVDPHRPTVTLTLADQAMDGNPDANVWGRYISSHAASGQYRGGGGAKTDVVITMNDTDGQDDLFGATGYYPAYNPPFDGYEQILFVDAKPVSYLKFFDFGSLYPTTPQNPNVVRVTPKDRWGLPGVEVVKTAQVLRFPGWLDNDDSSIEWDAATHRYNIHFGNKVVDEGGTLEQMVGTSIPFIGDKENRFLAEVNSDTTASLNPASAVAAPVTAHVLIKVVGETLFEESWSGAASPTDHFEIETNVQVDPLTLDASFLAVTFRLKDLNLFNYESPEIPLLAYGVPGVASINANVQFTLDVGLNAALTVAIDPGILQQPVLPPAEIGLASPTYIEPSIDAGAKIAGEIDLLGFDLAEISGTIHFKLNVAYGLPTPTNEWVDFEDFFSQACLDITGQIYGNIAAEVLGFEVFSFDTPSINIDFSGACDVVKGDGASLAAMGGGPVVPAAGTGSVTPLPPDAEKIPGGQAPVGPLRQDPRPNLVIDPVSGKAMYVQVVDTDPTSATFNNLAFSRRDGFGGAWTGLQTLADTAHAANPVLALAHDQLGSAAPAVVAYQVLNLPGNPSDKTRNQFLTAQDIAYRYFDGANWQTVHTFADPGYDTDPAIAFNDSGQGVLAWVHNTNATPISDTGSYWRHDQEIRVGKWSSADHQFVDPVTLTNDAVADSKPAAYVDENGKLYVLWLRDTQGGGNQIMFSTFDGSTWSAPAPLPTVGLSPGGRIGSLAVNSNGPGRINVLFSETRTLLDGPPDAQHPGGTPGTVQSRLLDRTTTLAAFTQPAPYQEVARGANYSTLRTTRAPGGALIAYWQNGDGRTNEVFATRLAPAAQGQVPWERPFRVTSGDDLEVKPSLAVDLVNGNPVYQVVYEAEVARGDDAGPPTLDPAVGAPTTAGVGSSSVKMAPELSFAKGIFFPFSVNEMTAGTPATAKARIINRGPAGDQVRVEYFSGPFGGAATKLGEQVVYLGPGATYDLNPIFTILAGDAVYAVQLTPLGGQEVVTASDDRSETRVIGKADLVISNLTPSDANPVGGQPITFTAEVRNLGNVAVGQFPVAFILGDPDLPIAFRHGNPNTPVPAPTQLGVIMVPGLGPKASTVVTFGWTVPVGGGDFTLTAIADRSLTPLNYTPIDESVETNNDRQLNLRVRGDAAIVPPVGTTIVNYSGVDNVNVHTSVRNNGQVTLKNVIVRLMWSVDDGGFIDQGVRLIPTLPPGASAPVFWLADGLAGLNRYRVLVDPFLQLGDSDPTNNVAETSVFLQGLPDLQPSKLSLNPPTPTQGEPLSVNAVITNAGIARARNVLVEVFATNAAVGRLLVGKMTIAELGALKNMEVSIPIDTSKLVGLTEILVVVDRLENILETSELNNSDSARFEFRAKGPVRGRHVFYNRSAFDGNNPAATAADDNAIATDKHALVPGGVATFDNVTSYSRGINGIMVDVNLAGRTPIPADFDFRIGNDNNPGAWPAAPAPTSMTIRRGAGVDRSDRITFVWPDGTIKNTWLQVTIKATATTGLGGPDTFYFGNRIAETGKVPVGATLVAVNGLDLTAIKRQISPVLVPISNPYDLNRDGRVTIADFMVARNNLTGSSLRLITAPAAIRANALAAALVRASAFSSSLVADYSSNDVLVGSRTDDFSLRLG